MGAGGSLLLTSAEDSARKSHMGAVGFTILLLCLWLQSEHTRDDNNLTLHF